MPWNMMGSLIHYCAECGSLMGEFGCPKCGGILIRSVRASETGSPDSSGIAGARGRLTHVSETLDPPQIDASTTPERGSNIFLGRLTAISLPSSAVQGAEFTLMVYFDSRTRQRLKERLSGLAGKNGMDDVRSWDTILTVALPSISPSTSRKSRSGGT